MNGSGLKNAAASPSVPLNMFLGNQTGNLQRTLANKSKEKAASVGPIGIILSSSNGIDKVDNKAWFLGLKSLCGRRAEGTSIEMRLPRVTPLLLKCCNLKKHNG